LFVEIILASSEVEVERYRYGSRCRFVALFYWQPGAASDMVATSLDFVRNENCESRHFFSRPVASTLPIQVPVVESGERSGLEQRLLSSRLLLTSSTALLDDEDRLAEQRQQEAECLMKLFALACRYSQ
jgi:hypothetical protein